MLEIGVQTHNAIADENPDAGFKMLADAGFTCCDFSLNYYHKNTELTEGKKNRFFDMSIEEIEAFFKPHKEAAKKNGIRMHQMHMPYPNFIPGAAQEINDYLIRKMAPKSMQVCDYLECKYIVVHGLKVKHFVGSEEAEWEKTEEVLDAIAPMAKKKGIIICVENLYDFSGKQLVEGPCCNAKKVVKRIDRFNEKYGTEVLGFCFDTGHANLVGIDFEPFITTLGKRLKVLHIHDNDGVADLHQVPFTFTKTRGNRPSTDWNGFVRGLKAIGYDQVLNFETAPVLKSFPEELRPQALHMLAQIGKYFANKMEG